MGIDKILEKEFDPGWNGKPKIKLKVHCSCGENYIIKEKFFSLTGTYTRKTKCPKCNDVSSLRHNLSYPDEGPKYLPEIVFEEVFD